MNRTELNSFQIQEIEIETLREQLKKIQDLNKTYINAFKFLQGEIVGKNINTTHPYYEYYLETCKRLNN
jgi:hypothetical protein